MTAFVDSADAPRAGTQGHFQPENSDGRERFDATRTLDLAELARVQRGEAGGALGAVGSVHHRQRP